MTIFGFTGTVEQWFVISLGLGAVAALVLIVAIGAVAFAFELTGIRAVGDDDAVDEEGWGR